MTKTSLISVVAVSIVMRKKMMIMYIAENEMGSANTSHIRIKKAKENEHDGE